MDSKTKWVGITLAAVLVLGIGAGILVDRFLLLARVESATNVDSDSDREQRHDDHAKRFRARLQRELDLTDEQKTRLDQVLENNHETAERFWEDSRARFEELRKSFREDIRSLLNPEQRAKFDEMLAKHDKERQERPEGEKNESRDGR